MKMRKVLLLVGGCLIAIGIFLALGGCSAIAQRTSAKPVPYSYYTPITIGAPVVEGQRVLAPVSLVDAQPVNSALAQTGLTGNYDLLLHVYSPTSLERARPALLKDLGLELVPSREPVEMLVVEKVK